MTGLLHYYGQRVILDDFHSDNKKVYRLSNDELDADGAVDSVIDFYAFKGINLLVLSSEKKSTCFKGCVRYIFAGLFYWYKREHFRNKEKCFLFHFESSYYS